MAFVLFFSPQIAYSKDRDTAKDKRAVVVLVSMKQCCPKSAWPEAEASTRAEFDALSMNVQVVDGLAKGEREQRIELEHIAVERKAACALRILKSTDGEKNWVDLWINDQITGKTTFRYISLEGSIDAESAQIAALRVVEALRASLLELTLPKINPDEKEPPPPSLNADYLVEKMSLERTERTSHPFGLRVGIETLGSPGNAGILGAVHVAFDLHLHRYFFLDIDGIVTVLGKSIEKDGAKSQLDLTVLRIWGSYAALDKGLFRPSLGIGVGAALAWARGFGSSDTLDFTMDYTFVSYLGASAELGLALTDNFWLRPGIRAGVLLPEIRVFFAGKEVAGLGLPLLEGFLDLEIRF